MHLNKTTVLFRGLAFAIDTIISTSLAMLIVNLFREGLFLSNNYLITYIGICLMIVRDLLGKSIGKYLLGIDILDTKSNTKAKLYQRLLKNITVPLSFIEILLVFLRKDHKRMGDMIAKTEIAINKNSYALSIFEQLVNK